jgi:hypothetical protein
MATTELEQLLNEFQSTAWRSTNSGNKTFQSSDMIAAALDEAASLVTPPQTARNPAQNPGSSDSNILESAASTFFKSGFGISPLISGLFDLFGGGEDPAPAPLVKYALPPRIDFFGAYSGGGASSADYDQRGTVRAYVPTAGPANFGTAPSNSPAEGAGSSGPQIQVNVQTMDARSFLDRSNDIARAVRDAMLNMNAINDVVSEL